MVSSPSEWCRPSASPIAIGSPPPTMALPPKKFVARSNRCMDPPRPRLQPSFLPYISASTDFIGYAAHERLSVLAISRDHPVALFQDRNYPDGDRLFAVVKMQESADLLLGVNLGALFLERRRMRIICFERSSSVRPR